MLEFLAMFDWISPAISLGQILTRGMGHTFYIYLDSGWTGSDCEEILESNGIDIYAKNVRNGCAMFQVSKKQANYAMRLLSREGVPFN